MLNADKGGIARRVLALERKGYLIRKPDERDRRKHHLYATERAQSLKQSRTALEEEFYSWLVEDLPEQERQQFLATLQTLYLRSKLESRAGFPTLLRRMKEHEK